jgi:hypothetical protein
VNPGSRYVSGCHLSKSEDRQHRAVTDRRSALTTTPTVTVTMNTGSPTSTPMQHLACRVLCLAEANRPAQYKGGTAHPYHNVKCSDKPPSEPIVTFTNLLLNNSLPNASIHPTPCLNESEVSSNATFLDFVRNNCTNIHILIWPVLANVSITRHPPAQHSQRDHCFNSLRGDLRASCCLMGDRQVCARQSLQALEQTMSVSDTMI